jgi:hypothetical protein
METGADVPTLYKAVCGVDPRFPIENLREAGNMLCPALTAVPESGGQNLSLPSCRIYASSLSSAKRTPLIGQTTGALPHWEAAFGNSCNAVSPMHPTLTLFRKKN